MRFKPFIFTAIAVCVLMAASAPSRVLAQGMEVTSAKVYIKQNELDKAETKLAEALEKDAEHKDANFYMGYIRYTQGRYEDMLAHWDKFETKKLGRREKDLHKKTVSDLYRQAFNKGIEGFNSQNWDAAISNFRVAARVKRDPKDFQAETNLGFALITADKIDEGLKVLEQVVETDPKNVGIWNGLLAGYIKKDDHKNIIRVYENYLPLTDEPDPNDYYRLGRSYAVLGDTLKAADVYEAGAKAVPDEMNFYLMASEIHARKENHAKATEILERGRKIDPTDMKILNSLGILYYIMKDFKKAVEPLEMLVQLEPLSIDGWQNLGDAYFGLAKQETDEAKAEEYTKMGLEYEEKSKELMRSGEGK